MIRRQNRMKTSPGAAAMEILRKQGRYGDTELAHVNPREKALLKALGGAGSRNPRTGLREYYDEGGGMSSEGAGAPSSTGMSGESAGEGTNDPGYGGGFGGSGGGGQIADLSQQDQQAIQGGGLIAGQNEVALSGLGAMGRGAGRALDTGMARLGETVTDPDAIPGFGLGGFLLGKAMSSLNRAARDAGMPIVDPGGARPWEGRTAEQAAREQAAFNASLPGMNAMGDSLAASIGAVPVANPTPRYLRGGEMAPPQEISSFIGPGMSDIQQRALISTYGTQGVNSAFRTDPVRRYYANLLSRGLISDAGAPVQNPYVLPIEQQYASSVLGRPFANPADAAATYESIRGFL